MSTGTDQIRQGECRFSLDLETICLEKACLMPFEGDRVLIILKLSKALD